MRLTNTHLLHATFRQRCAMLETRIRAQGLDIYLYEGARTPWRQAELYARGRTQGEPGKTVTSAEPWESFHQYGLAADWVFGGPGNWYWPKRTDSRWETFHEIAKGIGLDVLQSERPHVQLPWKLYDLKRGVYPPNGGLTWEEWLQDNIERWGCDFGAPPASDIDDRPPVGGM